MEEEYGRGRTEGRQERGEKERQKAKGRWRSSGALLAVGWEEGGVSELGRWASAEMGLLVFYETCPFWKKCFLIFLCLSVLSWARLHGKCMRSKWFLGMFYTCLGTQVEAGGSGRDGGAEILSSGLSSWSVEVRGTGPTPLKVTEKTTPGNGWSLWPGYVPGATYSVSLGQPLLSTSAIWQLYHLREQHRFRMRWHYQGGNSEGQDRVALANFHLAPENVLITCRLGMHSSGVGSELLYFHLCF